MVKSGDQVASIAFRSEGAFWNAFLVRSGESIFIGGVALVCVEGDKNVVRRQRFVSFIEDCVRCLMNEKLNIDVLFAEAKLLGKSDEV